MLLPIHEGAHWMLVVIEIRNKRIVFYDSLKNDGSVIMHLVLEYLNCESVARVGRPIDEWQWSMVNATAFSKQLNSYDCGVYVCKFAKQIFSNEWDTLPMNVVRRQISAEIRNTLPCRRHSE